jgi:hypothetical protein
MDALEFLSRLSLLTAWSVGCPGDQLQRQIWAGSLFVFFFFNVFFVAVFKSMCFAAPEVSQELLVLLLLSLLLHDCPKKLLEGKRNTDRETRTR